MAPLSESPGPQTCCHGVGEWFCQSPWLLGLPELCFGRCPLPREALTSLLPAQGPFRCAAYLCLVSVGHSVGTGTRGGLHPGPKSLPWLLQQLLRDACKENTEPLQQGDVGIMCLLRNLLLIPSKQLWLWVFVVVWGGGV